MRAGACTQRALGCECARERQRLISEEVQDHVVRPNIIAVIPDRSMITSIEGFKTFALRVAAPPGLTETRAVFQLLRRVLPQVRPARRW